MARETNIQLRPLDELTSQSSPVSPSSSYVYPVRSLLSGRIQPAIDQQPQTSRSRELSISNSDASPIPASFKLNKPIDGENAASHYQVLDVERGGEKNPTESQNEVCDNIYLQRFGELQAGPSQTRTKKGMKLAKTNCKVITKGFTWSLGTHSSKRSEDIGLSFPNFIHYPAGHEPSSSRTFTSHPATSSQPCSPDAHTFAAGPTGEPVPIAIPSSYDEMDELDHKHITQVTQLSGDIFSTIPMGPPISLSEQLPFNLSQYGLVHLPPLPCNGFNSDDHSETSGANSSQYSTAPSTQNSLIPADPSSQSATLPSSPKPRSHHVLESDFESQDESALPGSSASRSDSEPLTNMRYRHREDENGHHLVIGREGQLTSCEDEVFFQILIIFSVAERKYEAYSYTWSRPRVWRSHRCSRRYRQREFIRSSGIRGIFLIR